MNRSPSSTTLLHSLSRFPLALKRDALPQLLRRADDGGVGAPPSSMQGAPRVYDGVLVLPIRGLIVQRIEDIGGCDFPATLLDAFGSALHAARSDSNVRAVVLDISSPGGIVWGVPECAAKIRELSKVKPVHAVANAQAASAAFYLMAAAGKRYVTPSGEVGSVGVWTMHVDQSKMLKEWGLDVTLISEGEHKVDGNPFEPLPADVKKQMQKDVRETYETFRNDVAAYVGVSADTVENEWQARCVSASEALALGMVDGIATLEEVVAALQGESAISPRSPARSRSTPRRDESASVETRNADGTAVAAKDNIIGTALRYGSPSVDLGGFTEEFMSGAFADAVRTNADDIRVVWQHDPKYVFGRVSAGTATVREDVAGLHYTANPPDAQWARDAVESIRRGDVTQNSFAFYVPEPRKQNERWERRSTGLHRIITKARLIECGPQTNPAYPDTSVAVRSMRAAVAAGAVRPISDELQRYRDRARIVEATL